MAILVRLLRMLWHLAVGLVLVPLPAMLLLEFLDRIRLFGTVPPMIWTLTFLGSACAYWGWVWYSRQNHLHGLFTIEAQAQPGEGHDPETPPEVIPMPNLPSRPITHERTEFVIRTAHRLRTAGWRVEWFERSSPLDLDLVAGQDSMTVAFWCLPDPMVINSGDIRRAVEAGWRIGVNAAVLMTPEEPPGGIRNLAERSGLVLLTPKDIETLAAGFTRTRRSGTNGGVLR
ncbi:MAG: hypothetical protein AAGC57_01190 [Pseudomonadota bacterium]